MSGRIAGPHGSSRLLLLFCLGVLLTLAGCTVAPFGGPTEQERPVTLVVNNSANVTHTFEVHVVELPASMTIRYRDGTVEHVEIGQGLAGTDAGPRTITNITFSESARLFGRYTLKPGEEKQSSVENFSHNSALVVVTSKDDGDIFSWVSANCDDQTLVGLEVTSRPSENGEVDASYGCR